MTFLRNINIGVGRIPSSVSVGNTSTQILAANSSRRWASITNEGNKDIFVCCDQTALVNTGFILKRNGGSMVFGAEFMTLGIVNGITVSGTSTVIFQEANQS